MKRIIFTRLSVILMVLLAISSCKNEDPLTENLLATRPFQDSTNIVIGGGNTGNNGGGSTGGGAAGSEFFEFKVDGTLIEGVNPEYIQGFVGSASLVSHFSATRNILQFAFFTEPTSTGVTALLFNDANFSFDIASGVQYLPIDGELDITELNDDKIAGTFFFRATPFNTVGDTVTITEGIFSVNK